jgi:hypothetical protein
MALQCFDLGVERRFTGHQGIHLLVVVIVVPQ